MLNSFTATSAAHGCVSTGEPRCGLRETARGRCGLRFHWDRRPYFRADAGARHLVKTGTHTPPPTLPSPTWAPTLPWKSPGAPWTNPELDLPGKRTPVSCCRSAPLRRVSQLASGRTKSKPRAARMHTWRTSSLPAFVPPAGRLPGSRLESNETQNLLICW